VQLSGGSKKRGTWNIERPTLNVDCKGQSATVLISATLETGSSFEKLSGYLEDISHADSRFIILLARPSSISLCLAIGWLMPVSGFLYQS
jgi:hypothetical protein